MRRSRGPSRARTSFWQRSSSEGGSGHAPPRLRPSEAACLSYSGSWGRPPQGAPEPLFPLRCEISFSLLTSGDGLGPERRTPPGLGPYEDLDRARPAPSIRCLVASRATFCRFLHHGPSHVADALEPGRVAANRIQRAPSRRNDGREPTVRIAGCAGAAFTDDEAEITIAPLAGGGSSLQVEAYLPPGFTLVTQGTLSMTTSLNTQLPINFLVGNGSAALVDGASSIGFFAAASIVQRPPAVPEPAALFLLLFGGLVALGFHYCRQRRESPPVGTV